MGFWGNKVRGKGKLFHFPFLQCLIGSVSFLLGLFEDFCLGGRFGLFRELIELIGVTLWKDC